MFTFHYKVGDCFHLSFTLLADRVNRVISLVGSISVGPRSYGALGRESLGAPYLDFSRDEIEGITNRGSLTTNLSNATLSHRGPDLAHC